MVFSDDIFLFAFLPCVLLGYFLIKRWRVASNVFLLAANIVFYWWGAPKFVQILAVSVVANWLFGLLVDQTREKKRAQKAVVVLMVIFNLSLLGYYKYLDFFLESINAVLRSHIPVPEIALPIGISFFTFHAMSYVIDILRGEGKAQKNLFNVALYITFFPQLIAGPIVRYQTVAVELTDRTETFPDFMYGARRFLIGLCKKILLANNLAVLVDLAFNLKAGELSFATAWIAACAYLMQVYFDFGGYSDMAIGLARMFGFHFLENFNYPFVCKSVTGFWRRWHISLSTWFRDYLYFPLGGSRVKSVWRLLFNMCVVWSLTGLWHGAEWKYFLWGFGFFVLLAIERLTPLGKWMEKHILGHFYALLTVVAITVLIRATDMGNAGAFYGAMFLVNGPKIWDGISTVFLREYGWFLLASVVCSLPLYQIFRDRFKVPDGGIRIVGALILIALTLVCVTYVATDSYNPFIYFNF